MNTIVTAVSPQKVQWSIPEPPKRRLRDDFSDWMRVKNYARNTISTYISCVLEFVVFSGKRDPRTLGAAEVSLRVKDVDFERGVVSVLFAKGGKSRQVPLPESVRSALREHLDRLKLNFEQDGGWLAPLPNAYGEKNPGAERSWAWQYLFPARNLTADPQDGRLKR